MQINTKRYGKTTVLKPSSAIIFELILYWSGSNDNIAQLARACAAAIAIAIDKPGLPKYKPSIHKPDNFGHDCLNRLLNQGETTNTIFKTGSAILQYYADFLPTEEETEEAKDFLDSAPQDDTNV